MFLKEGGGLFLIELNLTFGVFLFLLSSSAYRLRCKVTEHRNTWKH